MDRDLSTEDRISEFKKWVRAGGAKGPDGDNALYNFFVSLDGALPAEELLDLVLTEFPTESRPSFVDSVVKEAAREDPLSAAKFLGAIPPGAMLSKAVEVISAGAASKGVDVDAFLAFVNELDFPEDREAALARYIDTRKWEGVALTDELALMDRLQSDSQRKQAALLWLSQRGAGSSALTAEEVAGILDKVQDPRVKAELAANIKMRQEMASAGKGKASGTQPEASSSGENFQGRGTSAFSVAAADFGFSKLSGLQEGAKEGDKQQAASAWFSKVANHDSEAAIKMFDEHPQLQTGPLTEYLAIHLVQKDRDQLREWMSTHSANPAVVSEGVENWADANSEEAGEWIYSLPEGDLQKNAATALLKWLEKKGDTAGAAALREALLQR